MKSLLDRLTEAQIKGAGARLTADEVIELVTILAPNGDAAGMHDADGFTPDGVDLTDPRERAAIALSLLSWHVPEDVPGLFAKDEAMVRESWAGAGDPDNPAHGAAVQHSKTNRHLYRRRAAAILAAYRGVS